jgi:hypothetical protein
MAHVPGGECYFNSFEFFDHTGSRKLRFVGLVPRNALVLTGVANFGVVGYPETEPHRRRLTSFLESEISQTHIRLLLPFLPSECASPPAFAVKALHFASMNAKPAALTARAAKRRGPPRWAFASFFKRKSRSKKEERGKQDDRKTARHLGRTTAGGCPWRIATRADITGKSRREREMPLPS